MLTFAELPVFTIIFDCADKSGSNDVVSIRSGIARASEDQSRHKSHGNFDQH